MKIHARKLEVHRTPEGVTIPIFRDYDMSGNVDAIRTSYITTVDAGHNKGPIIHSRRKSMFVYFGGELVIEYFDPETKSVVEHKLEHEGHVAIEIPNKLLVRYCNRHATEATTIIVYGDYAWRPDDSESMKYASWEDALSHISGA